MVSSYHINISEFFTLQLLIGTFCLLIARTSFQDLVIVFSIHIVITNNVSCDY
jgi:hypothetical protein